MKTAWLFLADGFEEVEAVTPIDYLRRAGVSVTIVGLPGTKVVSARNLTVVCDAGFDDLPLDRLPDLAVLPGGGKGSRNLAASGGLEKIVRSMLEKGLGVGAICAAPALALGGWGLLSGRRFTCYPEMDADLPVRSENSRVVVDGNLITAQAAGAAEEFSLELVRFLCGERAAGDLSSSILARR
jgi:DJ-1 family protein